MYREAGITEFRIKRFPVPTFRLGTQYYVCYREIIDKSAIWQLSSSLCGYTRIPSELLITVDPPTSATIKSPPS